MTERQAGRMSSNSHSAISDAAFDALLKKTRLGTKSTQAARLVLVQGMGKAHAARAAHIKHQQVCRAVSIIRKAARRQDVCVLCGQLNPHSTPNDNQTREEAGNP